MTRLDTSGWVMSTDHKGRPVATCQDDTVVSVDDDGDFSVVISDSTGEKAWIPSSIIAALLAAHVARGI